MDHELSAPEEASLQAHLEHCLECRADYAAQQDLWRLLGSVEALRAPDLFAKVEARLAERHRWMPSFAGLRLHLVGYGAAAAMAVALFAWAGVWAATAPRRVVPSELGRSVAELLSDVPPGLEVVALLDPIGERR